VAPDCGILRSDCLERAAAQVAGEDDVHDVLRDDAAGRRDRVDDCDRTFEWKLVVDADLLAELAVQRVDEALAGVDPPAW
jgi:hypothetical protein